MCLEDLQWGLNEIMHRDNAHKALGIVPPRSKMLDEWWRLLFLLLLLLLFIILNYKAAFQKLPSRWPKKCKVQTSRDSAKSPNQCWDHQTYHKCCECSAGLSWKFGNKLETCMNLKNVRDTANFKEPGRAPAESHLQSEFSISPATKVSLCHYWFLFVLVWFFLSPLATSFFFF